jgi:TonB family protein
VFHTLVASGPRARPSAHRFLLSVSFHGVAIAGAIALTRQASPLITSPQSIPALVYVAPQARRASLPAARDRVVSQTAPRPSWESFVQAPDLSPLVVSTTLPSVADLLDAPSVRPGSSPSLPGSLIGGAGPAAAGGLWTADSVDDPVEVIEQPSPRYPPILAQAGVAGRVELEYVVDTLGRAEPGSLHAVSSTRPEFEAAARAAVLGSRYRPARVHGQQVRQVVRQVLSFRAER